MAIESIEKLHFVEYDGEYEDIRVSSSSLTLHLWEKYSEKSCSDIPSYELLVGGSPRSATNNMVIAHGGPPKDEDNNLSVKTPHNLITEHGEMKLRLIWRPLPFWPAFTVLEDRLLEDSGCQGRQVSFLQ